MDIDPQAPSITFTASSPLLAAPTITYSGTFGAGPVNNGTPTAFLPTVQGGVTSGLLTITNGSVSQDLGYVYLGTGLGDTIAATAQTVPVYMFGFNGNDSLTGTAGDDFISGGHNLNTLVGGGGNDTLVGGWDGDSMVGGTGDDSFRPGLGADTIIGGADADTVDYSYSTAGLVSVNLVTGGVFNHAAGDTYSGIENVTGTAYADIIVGDTGNNVLTGGAGADSLVGGDGNDTIFGGDQTDTIIGGIGADLINITGAPPSIFDVVDYNAFNETMTGTFTNGGSVAAMDQIAGISFPLGAFPGLNLASIAFFSTFTGTVTPGYLAGAGVGLVQGNYDATGGTFSSGLGDDYVFQFSDGVDLGSILLVDTGLLGLTFGFTNGVLVPASLGSTGTYLSGTPGPDTLTAGAGPNLILGLAGNDTLAGTSGNDTIVGGPGADTMSSGTGSNVFRIGAGESSNTALDLITDFVSAFDNLDLPHVPVTFGGLGTAGADYSWTGVASTGTTAASLAADIATAVANVQGTGALLWANIGDTLSFELTGVSVAGTGEFILVQNLDGNSTYDAGTDLVIALVGGSTNPNTWTLADYV